MTLDWNKEKGLIPAIVQDSETHEILMLGYMNEESFKITQETGMVTFFSRTRQSLWKKGETSGNLLEVVSIAPDCDRDALLVQAKPRGPTCHRETSSCFENEFDFLKLLQGTIGNRMTHRPEGSYISKLLQDGEDRMIQKVGEEAIETVIAAKNEAPEDLQSEAADLLFHLMVLLQFKGLSLSEVVKTLKERHSA
jgi:phosphoribosyl-ATP pyrophosphohydrolase/phosphoribosyl-AMP cyclohydrolase